MDEKGYLFREWSSCRQALMILWYCFMFRNEDAQFLSFSNGSRITNLFAFFLIPVVVIPPSLMENTLSRVKVYPT